MKAAALRVERAQNFASAVSPDTRTDAAKEHWARDADVTNCHGCDSKFTFSLRKHHCRACGDIFCDACSWRRILLPTIAAMRKGKKERVCANCAIPVVMSTSVVPTVGGEMIVAGVNLGAAVRQIVFCVWFYFKKTFND